MDPLKISLEESAGLIRNAESEAAAGPSYIADFGDIKVIDGRFGPYIKQGVSNYKIPKGTVAANLTEADCQAIIAASDPTKKIKGKRKN